MEEDVVKGIIEGMLHGPDACATTFMNGEYDLRGYNQINDQVLRNSTMVKQNTTGESSTLKEDCQIQQVQGNVANEIIGSSDFWEMINGILKYVTVNIPDDPLQVDDQPALELLVNENIFIILLEFLYLQYLKCNKRCFSSQNNTEEIKS